LTKVVVEYTKDAITPISATYVYYIHYIIYVENM